jgi:hypothetical protein
MKRKDVNFGILFFWITLHPQTQCNKVLSIKVMKGCHTKMEWSLEKNAKRYVCD